MVFVKVYLFFLILNVVLGMLDTTLGELNAAGSPNADITLDFVDDPRIYDPTDINNSTFLAGNITNPLNQTGDPADIFNEQSDIDVFQVWELHRFIDGSFIFLTIDAFSTTIGIDLPTGFLNGLAVIFGLLFVLFVIFLVTGRSLSGLSG